LKIPPPDLISSELQAVEPFRSFAAMQMIVEDDLILKWEPSILKFKEVVGRFISINKKALILIRIRLFLL